MTDRPLLVCLLPVRNGASDLPAYLDGVRSFVDAVVALDDGSTDGTRAVLEADPLVVTVLTNPVRETYLGWDDGENRRRLLAAAGALEPRWVLSLDSDERIDPAEGRELRRFVAEEALPGLAYGFRVHRTWDDEDRVEVPGWWVFRLFAWEPGQEFPDRLLHFEPVPTSVARHRRARTSIRIRHLAGASAERRAERVAKYAEVDPDRSFGFAYQDLVEDVETAAWQAWVPGTPVLSPIEAAEHQDEPDDVALTAIVISRDDGPRIRRALRSVVDQEADDPVQVVVVTSGSGGAADIVRAEFPGVDLVDLPEPVLPGAARNAGLRVARGEYVSFPGSHVELPPGSLAARIRAHDEGYTMVTGTTLNGTDTPAGWASYVLDHSDVLPGRPSTDLRGAPAHCSYVRRALLRVGGFPEDLRAGEDTVVNERLVGLGFTARRAQDVHLVHHTRCDTPWRLLRHHAQRGRSYGRILLGQHRTTGHLLRRRGPLRQFSVQVWRRVRAIDANIERWGDDDLRRRYRSARPLVVLAATAHWIGTCAELLRPDAGKAFVLAGRPVVTVTTPRDMGSAGGHGSTARVDLVARRVQVVDAVVDGVAADGAGRWPRTRHPSAVWELVRSRGPEGPDASSRLALTWARLSLPDSRIHVISTEHRNPGDIVDADVLERLLDTRGRDERPRSRPEPAVRG